MSNALKSKMQSGFTLVELIAVIVILGVLAAVALPKFTSLSGDARVASLNAAKGSMTTASAMLHGKWLIKNENPIAVEGATINMVYGYPNAGSIGAAAGLTDDYSVTTVRPKNLPTNLNDTCKVMFTEAITAATPPVLGLPTPFLCE
jgi:MSHA pilin protein MshA